MSRSTRTCTAACRRFSPTRPASPRATERAGPRGGRRRPVSRRARLDTELVRRGLARSREQAAALVEAGRVKVAGRAAVKVATQVMTGEPIVVAPTDAGDDYVSRGGHKLAGALDVFQAAGLRVDGRRALDAGASTGGFTDVLLRRGAEHVVCVDVGYGQLAWSLQTDARVTVVDRTNVRDLEAATGRTAGRAGRRRPVVHLGPAGAAGVAAVRRARRRHRADGQAAVRGGSRAARPGWCRARSGAAGGRRPTRWRRRRTTTWGWA